MNLETEANNIIDQLRQETRADDLQQRRNAKQLLFIRNTIENLRRITSPLRRTTSSTPLQPGEAHKLLHLYQPESPSIPDILIRLTDDVANENEKEKRSA